MQSSSDPVVITTTPFKYSFRPSGPMTYVVSTEATAGEVHTYNGFEGYVTLDESMQTYDNLTLLATESGRADEVHRLGPDSIIDESKMRPLADRGFYLRVILDTNTTDKWESSFDANLSDMSAQIDWDEDGILEPETPILLTVYIPPDYHDFVTRMLQYDAHSSWRLDLGFISAAYRKPNKSHAFAIIGDSGGVASAHQIGFVQAPQNPLQSQIVPPGSTNELLNPEIEKIQHEEIREWIVDEPVLASYRNANYVERYNTLLRETAKQVAQYSNGLNETPSEFRERLREALGIIERTNSALNDSVADVPLDPELHEHDDAETEREKEKYVFWCHRDADHVFFWGWGTPGYRPPGTRKRLDEMAKEYVARPWMQTRLADWALVDALMFLSTIEVGEELKKRQPGVGRFLNIHLWYVKAHGNMVKMWRKRFQYWLIKWLIILGSPALVLWIAYGTEYQENVFIGVLVYSVAVIILLCGKLLQYVVRFFNASRTPYEKYAAAHDEMLEIYRGLDEKEPISVSLLRDRILASARNGAPWPHGLVAVLDSVVRSGRVIV